MPPIPRTPTEARKDGGTFYSPLPTPYSLLLLTAKSVFANSDERSVGLKHEPTTTLPHGPNRRAVGACRAPAAQSHARAQAGALATRDAQRAVVSDAHRLPVADAAARPAAVGS